MGMVTFIIRWHVSDGDLASDEALSGTSCHKPYNEQEVHTWACIHLIEQAFSALVTEECK